MPKAHFVIWPYKITFGEIDVVSQTFDLIGVTSALYGLSYLYRASDPWPQCIVHLTKYQHCLHSYLPQNIKID